MKALRSMGIHMALSALGAAGVLLTSPARGAGDAGARVPLATMPGDRPGPAPATPVRAAPIASIRAAIVDAARAPGARAVLVNVWATWCEPCQEELPDLLRFYRENRARGLRLVMISADDADRAEEAGRVLAAAAARAGLGARGAFDALLFLKSDDDMTFIDGLDPRWSGALPATFLHDGSGRRTRSWLSPITYADLQSGAGAALTTSPLTDRRKRDKTGAAPRTDTTKTSTKTSRRQP